MNEEISMGHARALIPLFRKDQLHLAEQITSRGLSVRETERRAQLCLNPPKPRTSVKDPNIQAAEQKLEERWKTRVEIKRRGKKGKIILHFHSPDDLERLYQDLWCCHPD
jgi:ParB family chromosome partitioning protein